MSEPTILIIEDDTTWQEILCDIVLDVNCQPCVADSYESALTALRKHHFVLATIDVSLSFDRHDNQDGVQVLRQLAQSMTVLPAIVITGHPTMALAIETLAELKAIHFFTKTDFDRAKLIQTIKEAIGQGASPVPLVVERQLNPTVREQFTAREIEVLYGLAQGQTNQEIAEQLVVSVNTVKKHVQNIYTKLAVNSRTAAVSQAFDVVSR